MTSFIASFIVHPTQYYSFRTRKTYHVLCVALVALVGTAAYAALAKFDELALQLLVSSAVVLLLAALGAVAEFTYYQRMDAIWTAKFQVVSELVKQHVQKQVDAGHKCKGLAKTGISNIFDFDESHSHADDVSTCAYYMAEDIEKLMPVDEFEDTADGRLRMRALIDDVLGMWDRTGPASGLNEPGQRQRMQKRRGYRADDEGPSGFLFGAKRTPPLAACFMVGLAHVCIVLGWRWAIG